jgi:hypothetical protein
MRTHLMIRCTVLAASFTLIQKIPFQAVQGGQPAPLRSWKRQPSIHETAVSLFLHRR